MKELSSVALPYASEQACSKLSTKNDCNVAGLTPVSSLPVKEVLKRQVLALNAESDSDAENPFFVADLGEVYRQYLRWKENFPRIEPFYAVKCNPDPMILRVLAALETGFDCASKNEIQSILDLGVDPSRIIYANPCKQASFIRFAEDNNVSMMTFDNAEELYKIKRYHPNARLVLRILTDDSKALCKLGLKFGASLESVGYLLQIAQELQLEVIGVSFHVGSGCYDENAFADAVYRARCAFDQAAQLGFDFRLLDVGGGFTHARYGNGITFEKIATVLNAAINKHFPPHIRVIAEPGRYFAASAFTIATNIIARRTVLRDHIDERGSDGDAITNGVNPTGNDHPAFMYYISDGMYGAFNCILFDHQIVSPKVLIKSGMFYFGTSVDEPEFPCSIWGPTCDSIDCITRSGSLPELHPGDWLYFEEMGAYTICAASQFNGFRRSPVFYTTTETAVFDFLQKDY